jgi:hypothetical protein
MKEAGDEPVLVEHLVLELRGRQAAQHHDETGPGLHR